jgi:hypothetical protein
VVDLFGRARETYGEASSLGCPFLLFAVAVLVGLWRFLTGDFRPVPALICSLPMVAILSPGAGQVLSYSLRPFVSAHLAQSLPFFVMHILSPGWWKKTL